MKGNIFILTGPSGCGKTTIAEALQQLARIERIITYTTRNPRSEEIDGKDYHFVSKKQFEKMITESKLLEYASVYGNYYGNSRSDIEQILAMGKNVLLSIDVQGAKTIKSMIPSAVVVFIMPPSLEILRQRLVKRGKDSAETIAVRMAEAEQEMKIAGYFDYAVTNDDLRQAIAEVKNIIMYTNPEKSKVLKSISEK